MSGELLAGVGVLLVIFVGGPLFAWYVNQERWK